MTTPIGSKIDALHALREDKRQLEEQLKAIEEQMQALEFEMITAMDNQGLTKLTGEKATVSISEVTRPSVEDWDAFYAFIKRHGYFHLLERRPAALACNEMMELKGKLPGVVPFTRRKLNMRSTS